MKGIFILRKLFLNDFWSHRFLVLFKNMPDLVLWAMNTTKYFHTFKKLALKYILLLTTIYLIYYGILWIWPNAIHTDHYSLHHNLFCSYSNAIFFAKKNILFLCFWNCNKLHNNAVNLSEISTDEMMHRPGLHAKTYIFYYLLYFWKSPAKT